MNQPVYLRHFNRRKPLATTERANKLPRIKLLEHIVKKAEVAPGVERCIVHWARAEKFSPELFPPWKPGEFPTQSFYPLERLCR
jgi:hypothetical protein